jgi:uncharacterized membrane protein YozB (DUF420 family)
LNCVFADKINRHKVSIHQDFILTGRAARRVFLVLALGTPGAINNIEFVKLASFLLSYFLPICFMRVAVIVNVIF